MVPQRRLRRLQGLQISDNIADLLRAENTVERRHLCIAILDPASQGLIGNFVAVRCKRPRFIQTLQARSNFWVGTVGVVAD